MAAQGWIFACYMYLPVNSSGRLVPRVIGNPYVTLVELYSDWLMIPIIEQDAVIFRS